jgi:hypothetical protein
MAQKPYIRSGTKNMKKILVLALAAIISSPSVNARNTVENYSITEALELPEAKAALGTDIKFYFGSQTHGAASMDLGEVRTNKKTNAFNKSDKEACQWVFLSAMIALRNTALERGGNAVIDIKSNYKNNLTVSDTTFQCGAGALISGVALVGTVVKI